MSAESEFECNSNAAQKSCCCFVDACALIVCARRDGSDIDVIKAGESSGLHPPCAESPRAQAASISCPALAASP